MPLAANDVCYKETQRRSEGRGKRRKQETERHTQVTVPMMLYWSSFVPESGCGLLKSTPGSCDARRQCDVLSEC
jgi:hypothetical protein